MKLSRCCFIHYHILQYKTMLYDKVGSEFIGFLNNSYLYYSKTLLNFILVSVVSMQCRSEDDEVAEEESC